MPPVSEPTWRNALTKTHKASFGRLLNLLGGGEIDPPFWDELEALLIQSDIGLPTTTGLLDQLRDQAHTEGMTKRAQVQEQLIDLLMGKLTEGPYPVSGTPPMVTLIVGVNGSGKTTSAAKLAHWLISRGSSVCLAAADTYRAAASEQLEIWAQRLEAKVISGAPGSDPGAVVYDACQSAVANALDHLIIDTSGRMHTEYNLMEELKKIDRVCGKVIESAPHTTLLVLDATTGQNGLAQAEAFAAAIGLDGTILAKLDTSARGGIAFAVQDRLGIPVTFAGTGEGIEDFTLFDPEAYVNGLLGND